MKTKLLLIAFLFISLSSYSQSDFSSARDKKQYDLCTDVAALKIINNYTTQSRLKLKSVDFDVIYRRMIDQPNEVHLSLHWFASTGTGRTILYWTSGVLKLGSDFCDAKFYVEESSSEVNTQYLPSDLGCLNRAEYLNQHLGPGKPLKITKKSRSSN